MELEVTGSLSSWVEWEFSPGALEDAFKTLLRDLPWHLTRLDVTGNYELDIMLYPLGDGHQPMAQLRRPRLRELHICCTLGDVRDKSGSPTYRTVYAGKALCSSLACS